MGYIAGISQGWIMIRATKEAVKQISTQEINKDITFTKYSLKVKNYMRFIIMLIILGIFMKALVNTYNFVLLDNFLEKEYKEDYVEYK